ncbi:MAG: FG-GAP repeat protein, partial [Chloroflexi bacterium]|nr:FG-GAP repeat protein [Chloroflexota bacterium]
GRAYGFGRDQGGTGNWGEVKKLTASDGQGGDELGWSVTVSGDTALVGAPSQHAEGSRTGAGYVFDLLLPKPPPPTPGPCPDIDGDTLCEDIDPDDDNDGCTDLAELQPKSEVTTGGGRDPLSYWDFMDMWATGTRDGVVNIIDISALVLRFGTMGELSGDPLNPPQALTGYHVSADRTPPEVSANPWNAGPPDGDINITEIALAIVQFGHNCT